MTIEANRTPSAVAPLAMLTEWQIADIIDFFLAVLSPGLQQEGAGPGHHYPPWAEWAVKRGPGTLVYWHTNTGQSLVIKDLTLCGSLSSLLAKPVLWRALRQNITKSTR